MNNIREIAETIYNNCFGENDVWWAKYCPFSDTSVKKPGKKFLCELNAIGVETYDTIRCQQTDWYFMVSTAENLYDIHLDWWNGFIEVNPTGFEGDSFIID